MLKDNVISYLEENKGEIITGGKMAMKFGVSRTAIWKVINTLRKEGHKIESIKNSGYKLKDASDVLSNNIISSMLKTNKFGKLMEIHKSLPSTNTYIKNNVSDNILEGYTVIANGQTSGRGRNGRIFFSPEQEGIYCSILLRPQIDFDKISSITICAVVAVCRAISKLVDIDLGIKWVNDIYAGNKKLCGILTEASISVEEKKLEYIVVGIGINTGLIDREVEEIATSILLESGLKGIRNECIAQILNEFEIIYNKFSNGNIKDVINDYNDRLIIKNKNVEIVQGDNINIVKILKLDDNGHLLAENKNGEIIKVLSGEIVRILNE